MNYKIDRNKLKSSAENLLEKTLEDIDKDGDYDKKRELGLILADYLRLLQFVENFNKLQNKIKNTLIQLK
ncbi:MAG: hypothetical protein Q8K60_00725 [Parachlamydiaceae bacterium]|nr:hypothetical protein [Parachlamydiaceae bacterium]